MWLSGLSGLSGDSGLANCSSLLLGISTLLLGVLQSLKDSWNETRNWTLTADPDAGLPAQGLYYPALSVKEGLQSTPSAWPFLGLE